jgi:hypothetical protein
MGRHILSGVHGKLLGVCLLFTGCVGWEWEPAVYTEYGEGVGLGVDWMDSGDRLVSEDQPWWAAGFTLTLVPPTRLLAEDLLPITGALGRLRVEEADSSTGDTLEMTDTAEHRWIMSWFTTLPLFLQLALLTFLAAIAWLQRENLKRAGRKLLSLMPGRGNGTAPTS